MTEHQTALRGKEAQALLDSTVFKDIWDGVENEAVEALANCSLKAKFKEDRDELIWHLQMVRKQKALLIGMVEQGKFAQHKIDREKDPMTVKSLYGRVVNW